MGPVFYLVQCDGVRDPISAVLLGNWPHGFALAPSRGKKGGRRLPRVTGCVFGGSGGLGRRFSVKRR